MTAGEPGGLDELSRRINWDTEFGGLLADHLEARVAAIEETIARRWPARWLAAARLRRSIRASMKNLPDKGGTWAERRSEAASLDFHAGRDQLDP